MKPERRCLCTGAQNCVRHASKEIRFEREPTAFKRGEHACNVYRSNARHERVGRGLQSCRGWFAGRLHNTILWHNDCNALMHFGTVHRAADWRCFEGPFIRLSFATKWLVRVYFALNRISRALSMFEQYKSEMS